MATQIGTLAAKIVADASGFTAGLNTAEKNAKAWGGRMGGIMKNALTIGLPTIGVGVFLNAMKDHIKTLENVGDAAANAGVALETYMNIVGSLDEGDTALATTALEKLRKTMGEVAMGNKEVIERLTKQGFDTHAMLLKTEEQNLRDVAKAINATSDSYLQGAKARSVFEKAGLSLMEIMPQLAGEGGGFNRFKGMEVSTMADIAELKDDITTFENMKSGTMSTWATMLSGLKDVLEGEGNKGFSKLVGEGAFRTIVGVDSDAIQRRAFNKAQEQKKRDEKEAGRLAAEAEDTKLSHGAQAFGIVLDQLGRKFGEGRKIVADYTKMFTDAAEKQRKAWEKATQTLEDMEAEATQLKLSLKTPAEIFQEQIERIDFIADRDLFTPEQREKLKAKAVMDLPDVAAIERGPAPRALEKGSAEEISARTDFERRSTAPSMTTAEETKAKLEGIRSESTKTNTKLDEIIRFWKDNKQYVVK